MNIDISQYTADDRVSFGLHVGERIATAIHNGVRLNEACQKMKDAGIVSPGMAQRIRENMETTDELLHDLYAELQVWAETGRSTL